MLKCKPTFIYRASVGSEVSWIEQQLSSFDLGVEGGGSSACGSAARGAVDNFRLCATC